MSQRWCIASGLIALLDVAECKYELPTIKGSCATSPTLLPREKGAKFLSPRLLGEGEFENSYIYSAKYTLLLSGCGGEKGIWIIHNNISQVNNSPARSVGNIAESFFDKGNALAASQKYEEAICLGFFNK